MREIFIKYNPYKLETEVLIDGKSPRATSKLNKGEERLQEWIEDLPDILQTELNTNSFKLKFQGTVLDFEDVAEMAEAAKKQGINIELDHIPAKEVKDKEQAIAEIFEEIQKGPYDELRQPDVIKAFNNAKGSDFEVNVVATMSAGKSTLINSLLQQKLMPAKQEACTATITEIKDNDKNVFTAKAYDKNGVLIQTHPELTYDIMKSLNDNKEVSRIRVEGNIPFVTAEDVSLILVDTPGPNNSRDPEHKAATYRMLSESSKTVVLYIMNATQLAVNDDYNLLTTVAESMSVGGKQSRDRFIFVVNKLDDFRKGEDSVDAAISKVRDYLKDNGIENANIFPASALTALDIRTILAESEDDDDDDVYAAKGKVRKFNKNEELHFEKYAPLTPSVRGTIEAMLSKAKEEDDVKTQALIHSGIIPIEQAIKMYVRKYAKTAKIKNIVDTFAKRLESAGSFEKTKQNIAENQEKHNEILANIDMIKRKLNSGNEAKKFKDVISKINYDSEAEKIADNIIRKAQDRITSEKESINKKLSKREANEMLSSFSKITENLQAEVQVSLQDLLTKNMIKNAGELLEQYKIKLSELMQDIDIGDIALNPFEIMQGEIKTNADSLINSMVKTERVQIGKEWVENTSKRWWKPWTWFQEKGHYEAVYGDKEYVEGDALAVKFFSPFEKNLYSNRDSALKYAKQQTEAIKSEFAKKFDELDSILKIKLKELEDYATDKENAEKLIKESQDRLKWLENIQSKVNSILDI